MFLGNLCLSLALVFALISAIFFLWGARADEKPLSLARKFYYFFFFFTFLASAYLMYLFLGHHFQVEYVYNYSSSAEPFFYLISGFWAGQEGSFLLWLFLGSWLGVFLIRKKKSSQLFSEESGIHQGYVMFFYLLVQIFLLVLLLKKSPFSTLPNVPPDGKGLNPLLKDFWMVIHPPVVFAGYAGLAIPFAYALSALSRNRYEGWVGLTLPWAGLSSLLLGAGIFIGAYWAYKVLGWGGYWGWDPVENASLVPWLLSVALIHGLILEKTRNMFRRTNLLLAISSFLMVVYATFLVRSGVLGDFSVHSFIDLGINTFLLIFIMFFVFLSLGLFLSRLSGIPRSRIGDNILTREFSLFSAIILFALSAVLILLGTSSSLISRIFGPPSSVSIPYYIRTQLPLSILVFIALGAAPFLRWKGSDVTELLKNLRFSFFAAAVLTALAFAFKVRSIIHLICIFTACLAIVNNLFVLVKRKRGGLKFAGGFLTHMGAGILLVGIITSSGYDQSKKISLPRGETEEAFGYQFTYLGTENSAKGTNDFLKIKVQKGSTHFIARPQYYFSEYNQGIMRSPHIKINLLYDLYLSPEDRIQGEVSEENFIQIRKGETKEKRGYSIEFLDFDLTSHAQSGQISVGAILNVEHKGEKGTLIPTMVMGGREGSEDARMVHLPGGKDYLVLEKIDADRKIVTLRLILQDEIASEDILVLSIDKKPLINLFWLGTILIMVGLGIATYRRTKEAERR